LVTLDLVQYCNAKLLEFARINNEAAFNYAHELSDVRSPSEFIEITTRHAREQLAVLREQAKEVATLGQKATLKTAEPFKSESGTGGGVGGKLTTARSLQLSTFRRKEIVGSAIILALKDSSGEHAKLFIGIKKAGAVVDPDQ
jgi:Phasin protein